MNMLKKWSWNINLYMKWQEHFFYRFLKALWKRLPTMDGNPEPSIYKLPYNISQIKSEQTK